MLLEAKQVQAARKLFELYKKSKAMKESFAFTMDPAAEAAVQDMIDAAVIAEMLSPHGARGCSSGWRDSTWLIMASGKKATTRQRIDAMQQLVDLHPSKKFKIIRMMIDKLHDAQVCCS